MKQYPGFEYNVIKRPYLKYWRIKVSKDGGVSVVVNTTSNMEDVKKFVSSKTKWIESMIERNNRQKESVNKIKEEKKGQLLHRGEWYNILRTGQEKGGAVLLNDDNKTLCVSAGNEERINDRLVKWQRNTARRIIGDLAVMTGKEMGVECNKIFLRSQKSRWGGCSPKRKNISINWMLVRAPEDILKYVVIHELCHIKESSHSGKYWDMVAAYYPQHKEAKKWLKDNGEVLYINTI